MWPIKMNPEDVVDVNYEGLDFPTSFLTFKPLLFKNGQVFCCLLGPDLQDGIFGFGDTVHSAVNYWDKEFKKRLIRNPKNDPIARFVAFKIRTIRKLQVH